MKMAKLLAIVLMIAMMVSVVGCGNTTQNGVSDVEDNVTDSQFKGMVDEEYVPAPENLIGIAVCPYELNMWNVGDLIPIDVSTRWGTAYIEEVEDGFVFCGTMWNLSAGTRKGFFAEYVMDTTNYRGLYMGYIYLIDGEVYVLATKDLVAFDENNSAICRMDTPYTDADGIVLDIELRIQRQ